MIIQLPRDSINKCKYEVFKLDLETLNNNTLEYLELQCKNILTSRKIVNPPEGTCVLEEIMDDAHTMGLDPDDPSIEPQYRKQYKAYRERKADEQKVRS